MSQLADLISSFDIDMGADPSQDDETRALLSPTSTSDKLPSAMWGQFCFDLIMLHPNHTQVCADYGISEAHLMELLSNPSFTDRLKDARVQVKTLGPSAGFVLTARTEAERHLVTLGRLAGQESVHPGVRVKAIENIVRYAHLDPATQRQEKETAAEKASTGVTVQFNIGGGLLGAGMKTIEVTPTQPREDDE